MKIVALGDIHQPFAHKRALEWAIKHTQDADMVLQGGDLNDQYTFSKYPRSLNVIKPSDEHRLARVANERMWAKIKKRAKRNAKCVQLMGNHDLRFYHRVMEKLPELEGMVKDQYEFDGVETVYDARAEFTYKGILFEHGHRSKLGDHVRYNHKRTVRFHDHTGGLVMFRRGTGMLWELDAGWLGNERAKVFSYTNTKTTGWTLGVAVIDDLGPRFIPYPG